MTGERRYHCFANIPTDKAFSKDSVWNIKHVQEMDESDPINDLEDYNAEVLKEVTVNLFNKQSAFFKSFPSGHFQIQENESIVGLTNDFKCISVCKQTLHG